MVLIRFALLLALWASTLAKDDQKWVWHDNTRDQSISRVNFDREPRYEVFEHEEHYQPSHLYNQRPFSYRPYPKPGGVYGGTTSGVHYGQNHPHENPEPEILTGPVPSWEKEGPFKEFDRCKCTEKFNCNTPGISYGHCDVGKQYCCYSTKKVNQLGGPNPSRPVHSIDNGILVGPGGPHDFPRPGYGGLNRPKPGGFGLGGGSRVDGPISSRPVHSPENGILVGPGGPFDRPIGGRPGGGYGGHVGGYGRLRNH